MTDLSTAQVGTEGLNLTVAQLSFVAVSLLGHCQSSSVARVHLHSRQWSALTKVPSAICASGHIIMCRTLVTVRWPSGKACASRAEDPWFESHLRQGCPGSSHTSDVKIGTAVAACLVSGDNGSVSSGTGGGRRDWGR